MKFTAEISATKADFLDTTVYRNDDGSLWTDLFCKPTDTHSYLRYESSHPPHCKRSLPYSQFLRLRRICSREEDFTKHAKNMKSHFIGRGYPEQILDDSLEKVKLLSRKSLLTPKTIPTKTTQSTGEEVTVYAITTYHPTQQAFHKIIDSNLNLLDSPGTQELFEARIYLFYLFIYCHLYSAFSIVQCSNALYKDNLWASQTKESQGTSCSCSSETTSH